MLARQRRFIRINDEKVLNRRTENEFNKFRMNVFSSFSPSQYDKRAQYTSGNKFFNSIKS